jgi:hypothetical protein
MQMLRVRVHVQQLINFKCIRNLLVPMRGEKKGYSVVLLMMACHPAGQVVCIDVVNLFFLFFMSLAFILL